ncbi:SPW repeat domain-containing protein [Pseudonocardia bannensis]
MTFLAGIWLVLAPFALNYMTGSGFDASRNDLVIGATIALVAIVRTVVPVRSTALGTVNVALGAWLIIAPSLLAYTAGADALTPTWNDVLVGVIVLILAAAGALLGPRRLSTRSDAVGAGS